MLRVLAVVPHELVLLLLLPKHQQVSTGGEVDREEGAYLLGSKRGELPFQAPSTIRSVLNGGDDEESCTNK